MRSEKLSLSSTCDYVLCAGTDREGNYYELVADQKEFASGFEITIGVIKNNSWIYPMSKNFPFLEDDNLLHVTATDLKTEGVSLKSPQRVIEKIYFVDTGAFLLDCYRTLSLSSPRQYQDYFPAYMIFDCDSSDTYTLDRREFDLTYLSQKAEFVWGDSKPLSYGQISTEDGKVIMCKNLTEEEGNPIYDWCLFDMKSLKYDVIASRVEGIRPRGILSEGLFLASDQCFYNTAGQKVIDLSSYDIDEFNARQSYFVDGTCTFTAKNSLGTEFRVTIDSTGNVLSENRTN